MARAMRHNACQRFVCPGVWLLLERVVPPFTRGLRAGQLLRMPVAHAEGNYEDSPRRLDALETAGLVAFRYTSPAGELDPAWNPNGAARAIAGICNPERNVLGLMPHLERCAEEILGSTDGLAIFSGALATLRDLSAASRAPPGPRAPAAPRCRAR